MEAGQIESPSLGSGYDGLKLPELGVREGAGYQGKVGEGGYAFIHHPGQVAFVEAFE